MSERKRNAAFAGRGSTADPGTPFAQGLYDPALDKDSCGVGFIADIKGRKSHQTHRRRLAHSLQSRASRRGRRRSAHGRRRRHPGADPAQVLCQEDCRARLQIAGRRRIRRRLSVHAAGSELAADHPRHLCRGHCAREADAARLARRADRQFDARRVGQADRAEAHAGVHRPRQEEDVGGRVRTPALHPAQVDLERDLSPARAPHLRLLPGVDLVPHGDLQGHVPGRPARHLLSRPARSGFRERARAGAPALLDQHVPDLVAGASVPLHRAQRRDQHAARQRQLDGGAAGVGFLAAVRQGHQQAVADLLRRPVRHRLLRQRARIPHAGRLLARARDDDDDSGSLGRQSAHGRGTPRLLRIQRRADGAVGRPGGDRLHQRPADRRHARPQRLAPGALSAHARRPHRHGLRDGRAADPGKGHRQEVAAAAGQDAAGRSRRGPAHSR